ncbi:unnamed protein product [Prorocentrum cordatum]|uniref:Uncharacterized protein n=1 Tax=Prorocentrum cordatum TaxID=2364126 RepID=A0ABN9VDM2_9DINO|nr:unnamed protein product [Polarella glacialis]
MPPAWPPTSASANCGAGPPFATYSARPSRAPKYGSLSSWNFFSCSSVSVPRPSPTSPLPIMVPSSDFMTVQAQYSEEMSYLKMPSFFFIQPRGTFSSISGHEHSGIATSQKAAIFRGQPLMSDFESLY